MPSSAQNVMSNTRERSSQDWAARAAELKLQLLAGKDRTEIPSESSTSDRESQSSAVSMSTDYTKTVPRSLAAPTKALPPAPEIMTAEVDHNEAQKLQKDLKELEKIIAFGAARIPALNSANIMKLPHGGQFTIKHTASTPPKSSINMNDRKKGQANEAEIADRKGDLATRRVSYDTDKDHTTTRTPPQDIKTLESSQIQLNDDSKHLDDDYIGRCHSKEQRKSSRIEADTPEDGEIQSNGSQASSQGDAQGTLLPSARLSRSATSISSNTPASTTRQEQTLPHIKTTLPVQKMADPEKSVSRPSPRDQTPPMAPRSQRRHGWELQHNQPSPSEAQKDQDRDRNPRGSTRRPFRQPSLGPARPDAPIRKHPRDSYFEHDRAPLHDRDLKDWLSFTGWHNREFRADFLQRKRRLAYLDREKDEIEQERAELMSTEQGVRALRFDSLSYRSNSSVRDDADGFEADHPPRNSGRELFSSPAPGHRRKREYTSDGDNEAPRKMNRMDTGDRRRDASSYGSRVDFPFGDPRRTPDHLASEYGPRGFMSLHNRTNACVSFRSSTAPYCYSSSIQLFPTKPRWAPLERGGSLPSRFKLQLPSRPQK